MTPNIQLQVQWLRLCFKCTACQQMMSAARSYCTSPVRCNVTCQKLKGRLSPALCFVHKHFIDHIFSPAFKLKKQNKHLKVVCRVELFQRGLHFCLTAFQHLCFHTKSSRKVSETRNLIEHLLHLNGAQRWYLKIRLTDSPPEPNTIHYYIYSFILKSSPIKVLLKANSWLISAVLSHLKACNWQQWIPTSLHQSQPLISFSNWIKVSASLKGDLQQPAQNIPALWVFSRQSGMPNNN